MSNHFTGLSLGPPLGDQLLDLCDLYAFRSPVDKNKFDFDGINNLEKRRQRHGENLP